MAQCKIFADSLKKEINRKNIFLNFNSSNENCNLKGKIM